MDYILIGDKNYSSFEEILFLENHTPGVPLVLLGVLENEQPIAAAAMEIDDHVTRLISIYVEKPHRKKGIGAGLVNQLSEYTHANDLDALEVDFVETEDLQEFFKHTGFTLFHGTEVLYLPMDDVIETKRFKLFLDNADKELHCASFSSLSNRMIREAYQKAGLTYDKTMEDSLNADYSSLLMTAENQPVGMITLMNWGSDLVITDLLVGDYGLPGYGTLFNHLYNKLKNKKGTGLYVGFIGEDDKKMNLVSEIAGDMIDFEKGETIIHGLLG